LPLNDRQIRMIGAGKYETQNGSPTVSEGTAKQATERKPKKREERG